MIYLDEHEQMMLGGEYGSSIQKAMELLVKVGDAYNAGRMINVNKAHVIALPDFFDLLSALINDGTAKILTTANPLFLNLQRAREMNIPESVVEEGRKAVIREQEIYQRMNAIPSYTCYPYPLYDLRKGEHVAFTESNIAIFANSWFGAKTNLEGTSTAVASAMTGKTPEYGLHLQENRHGKVLIEVAPALEPGQFDYADYVALAHWAGGHLIDRIPVYCGLPKNITPGQAKYMCSAQIYRSAAAMFHIVGVTPEAPTTEAAFGDRKPEEKFTFGNRERKQAYEELCSATETRIDMVCIGCPDCTLQELAEIARLLNGRRISKHVRLWIGTSEFFRVLAKQMGLIDIIEGAGGLVISDMCVRFGAIPPLSDALGVRVVATTSGSIAQNAYRRSKERTSAWFGTTKNCIDAAVTGKWEA
jgi:predicted aconitase